MSDPPTKPLNSNAAATAGHSHQLHCQKCLADNPSSPVGYSRLAVAINDRGQLIVSCVRHQVMVGSFTLLELPHFGCQICDAARQPPGHA
jgi:hypothetical protein